MKLHLGEEEGRRRSRKRRKRKKKRRRKEPGMVAHAIIPALWEAKVGGSPEAKCLRPAWPMWQTPVSIKNTKS